MEETGGGFFQVRRDHGGPGIDGKIIRLRVDQYRFPGSAGRGNQCLDSCQGSLAIVGKHHHITVFQLLPVFLQQGGAIDGFETVLKIQPDQLLVPADDTQLGDSRGIRDPLEGAPDACTVQHGFQ